jgi:hypothetical protein
MKTIDNHRNYLNNTFLSGEYELKQHNGDTILDFGHGYFYTVAEINLLLEKTTHVLNRIKEKQDRLYPNGITLPAQKSSTKVYFINNIDFLKDNFEISEKHLSVRFHGAVIYSKTEVETLNKRFKILNKEITS